MNKTRFSLYKTWFYFGVGQAPATRTPAAATAAKAKLNAKP
jgi:hypothetical protein